MKKIIFIIPALFIAFSFLACEDEPAPPVSDDLREEIDRKWYCEFNDGIDVRNYESIISLDSENDSRILIGNFGGFDADAPAYATVYDDYTIELPQQDLSGTSSSVKGTAEINTDFTRIDWTCTVTDTEGTYNATITYTLSDITKKLLQ